MSPTHFPISSLVELTEDARGRPFWKSERWRNGVGRVIGAVNGNLVVSMRLPAGLSKTYYIRPEMLREVAPKKAAPLFTLSQVEYYENLARVAIRRMWAHRALVEHRRQIRLWIGTLRDAQRVRVYRNWQ